MLCQVLVMQHVVLIDNLCRTAAGELGFLHSSHWCEMNVAVRYLVKFGLASVLNEINLLLKLVKPTVHWLLY
jgi:hypothetical protein